MPSACVRHRASISIVDGVDAQLIDPHRDGGRRFRTELVEYLLVS